MVITDTKGNQHEATITNDRLTVTIPDRLFAAVPQFDGWRGYWVARNGTTCRLVYTKEQSDDRG